MATMEQLRDRLVTRQVEARGVRDPLVLAAMRAVQREAFVPKELRREAYDDTPLPIGSGQTISQPYIVAFMIEALGLRGGEKVLEIGTGSGYAAAILSEIASDVFTIERIGQLAESAARNLASAGCDNVHVRHADGTEGWSEESPSTRYLFRQARLTFQKPSFANSKLGPVWWCPSVAIRDLRNLSGSRAEATMSSSVRISPMCGSCRSSVKKAGKAETTFGKRSLPTSC